MDASAVLMRMINYGGSLLYGCHLSQAVNVSLSTLHVYESAFFWVSKFGFLAISHRSSFDALEKGLDLPPLKADYTDGKSGLDFNDAFFYCCPFFLTAISITY